MSDVVPAGFPVLNAWLERAVPEHPLLVNRIDDDLLAPLEEILTDLETTRPMRLTDKRKAFRTLKSLDGLIEQRAELLVGSLLAKASIPFDFGEHHPDLVLTSGNGGIEVGSRRLDGPRRLFERLADAFETATASGCQIVLTFDRRLLKIGTERIEEAKDEIVRAAQTGSGVLRFDDIGLTVGISEDAGIESPQVTMFNQKLGVSLSDHLDDVLREFRNKINEKRRQASEMPTVLLLDFSRVGDAWMISKETWTRALHSLLKGETNEDEPYVGFALMFTSLDAWLPMKLAAVVSSDAPTAMHAVFDGLARLFNLDKE